MFTLILSVLVFFFIYLTLCVPTSELTFFGRVKISLITIIKKFYSLLPKFLQTILYNQYDYLVNKPNPTIQILYLLLVLGLFYFYHAFGVYVFFPHKVLGYYLLFPAYALLAISIITFFVASTTDPGVITKKRINDLKKKYPIPSLFSDYTKNECSKCKIPLIPRSKHCYVCDVCIEKFDHHCIWVNKCIGVKNYRYFLLFLLSHCLLTAYAGGLGFTLLYYYIIENDLFHATFFNSATKERIDSDYLIVFKYVIGHHYAFFATNTMLVVIGITLLVFFLYHIYMIKGGFTTNERNKQVKTIRTMKILREILIEVAKVKKYTFHFKQLSGDEIQKYKHITFYEPETDLEKLTEEEINTFYNFTEQSVFIFRRNPYNKGFYQNMIDIIKGQ